MGSSPIPSFADVDRGERVKAVREALGLSHDSFAELSGGKLSRPLLIAIEKGRNKATGEEARSGLAYALGVSLDQLSSFLDGSMPLETVISIARRRTAEIRGNVAPEPKSPEAQGADLAVLTRLEHSRHARFPRLELTIAYWEASGKTWPQDVILAASAGHFGDHDWSPQEWAEKLDYLEKVLREAREKASGHYRARVDTERS